MCHRAAGQHKASAMARTMRSFVVVVEEEYIDLDLTSCRHSAEPPSPACKNSAMQQQCGTVAPPRPETARRRTSVCAKWRASAALLRALFAKSSCSDESCHGIGNGSVRASCNGSTVASSLRSSIEKEKQMEEEDSWSHHRKSFSGVIRWRLSHSSSVSSLSTSWSSSSSSTSSVGSGAEQKPVVAKRSSSGRSEVESLIQGAIAYCKKSHEQLVLARD